MSKQLVYESTQPGVLGVRKSAKTFNKLTGEPEVRRSIHVNFERQQTEPDLKGRFRVYGIAKIDQRFLDDNETTFEAIHELVMSDRMKRAFGAIKCIVGPGTELPKAVQEAEAADSSPTFPKPKDKK